MGGTIEARISEEASRAEAEGNDLVPWVKGCVLLYTAERFTAGGIGNPAVDIVRVITESSGGKYLVIKRTGNSDWSRMETTAHAIDRAIQEADVPLTTLTDKVEGLLSDGIRHANPERIGPFRPLPSKGAHLEALGKVITLFDVGMLAE